MNKYVLDSYALMVLTQKESGWQRVMDIIKSANNGSVELYMSVINMAEVNYMLARRGKNTPQITSAIQALPIILASADEYIEEVTSLKAEYAISLADCFGAVLAKALDCPIVTGDPEFRKLDKIIKIVWLK